MKTNTLFALIAAAGLAGAAGAAENWSEDQQAAAEVFRTWARAEVAGDQEKIMALLAPELTVWEFRRPAPMDRAGYENMLAGLLRQMKAVACEMEPATVVVKGPVALAGGRFAGTFVDQQGREVKSQGPWTATLLRAGGGWQVLNVSYLEEAGRAAQAAGTGTEADAAREIAALEHAWAKAYVDRDVATLDRIEAETWICTTDDGKQVTKAEDLADVKSATYQATVFRMEEVKVRVFGDAAVATALQTEQATYKGTEANKVLRCTDTWVRRDGRWQCVATHLSPAKDSRSP